MKTLVLGVAPQRHVGVEVPALLGVVGGRADEGEADRVHHTLDGQRGLVTGDGRGLLGR